MATWISLGSPPLIFSSQAIISLRPVPPWAKLRCPIFLPCPAQSETTCSCDAQSIPTNHCRSPCMMHFPLLGAIQGAPLIVHATRATATLSGSCTGALRRGFPTGHRSRPFRRGTSPLEALTNNIGALDDNGSSRRIGSAQEGTSVRAVARGGTRRFATLHSACHHAATFLEPRGKTYRMTWPP